MTKPEGSLISYFSDRVKAEGGINLAQGTPGFAPPGELLRILELEAIKQKAHQYAPGIGNFELLEQIRLHFKTRCALEKDNLLIVQGATEGIFLTFFYLTTILQHPYSALSFDPVYESYPRLAGMFGVPFVFTDFDRRQGVDFSKLETIIKEKNVKIVFIASPGNPLGKAWNYDEMQEMVRLSREYGFYILFDAVYKDLYFDSEPFNPLCLQEPKLFYIDSFSKMLSITGWRIGYIIAERGHMGKIRAMHDYTGLCAPSLLQTAIARYLADNDYGQTYIPGIRNRCKQSFFFMKSELEKVGFTVMKSDGGYFLWAALPGEWDDAFQFSLSLFDKLKLAVVPGENFSLSKKNFIRINIAVELTLLQEAASRLKEFFAAARPEESVK